MLVVSWLLMLWLRAQGVSLQVTWSHPSDLKQDQSISPLALCLACQRFCLHPPRAAAGAILAFLGGFRGCPGSRRSHFGMYLRATSWTFLFAAKENVGSNSLRLNTALSREKDLYFPASKFTFYFNLLFYFFSSRFCVFNAFLRKKGFLHGRRMSTQTHTWMLQQQVRNSFPFISHSPFFRLNSSSLIKASEVSQTQKIQSLAEVTNIFFIFWQGFGIVWG